MTMLPLAANAAKLRRATALIEALRQQPPAPKMPDWAAERRARDAHRNVRIGARVVRDPKTRLFHVEPLVNGKAVGRPLDAGRGARITVFMVAERALHAAGRRAGLTRAQVEERIRSKRWTLSTRGVD